MEKDRTLFIISRNSEYRRSNDGNEYTRTTAKYNVCVSHGSYSVSTRCGDLTFLMLSILNVGLANTLHLSCLFWLLHNGYLGVHCQKRFWGHGQVLKATTAWALSVYEPRRGSRWSVLGRGTQSLCWEPDPWEYSPPPSPSSDLAVHVFPVQVWHPGMSCFLSDGVNTIRSEHRSQGVKEIVKEDLSGV